MASLLAGCLFFIKADPEWDQPPANLIIFPWDGCVLKALMHQELFGTDLQRFGLTESDYLHQVGPMDELVRRLQTHGVVVLDASPALLDPKTKSYPMIARALPLYTDTDHLSPHAATLVMSYIFERLSPADDSAAKRSIFTSPIHPESVEIPTNQ